MQLHRRRSLGGPCVAVGDGHRERFLEGEDVLDRGVVAQGVEEPLVNGARIFEEVPDGDELLDEREPSWPSLRRAHSPSGWNPHRRSPVSRTSTIFCPVR